MIASPWHRLDPRRSLTARLLGLVIGGFVLVAALTIWAAGRQLRERIYGVLGVQFENLATQVGDRVDATLAQRTHELRYVAALPVFQTDDRSAERRHVLEALREASPDFAWIGFVTPDGVIRSAAEGTGEGSIVQGRSWFLLSGEQPYVGAFRVRPAFMAGQAGADDAGLLDLAVPVRNTSGKLIGVIGAYLHTDWLAEIERLALPPTAARDALGLTLYAADGEVLFDSGRSGWTRPPPALVLRDRGAPSGTILERTDDGAAYVTGFMRSRGYRDFEGTGWSVAVRQPASRAFAPVAALRTALLVWFALVCVGLAVLILLVIARLERQLASIGAAANRIRAGDVVTEMPRLTGDVELRRMSNAVADLVAALRAPAPKQSPPNQSPVPAPSPSASDDRPRPILW